LFSFFHRLFHSKFTFRLLRRIFLAMLCSLALTILTTLLILWPASRNEIVVEMNAINNEIVNLISNVSTDMIDSTNRILNSAQLRERLMVYHQHPDNRSFNYVRLILFRETNALDNARMAVLDTHNGTRFDTIVGFTPEDMAVLYSMQYIRISNTFFAYGFSEIYIADDEQKTPTIAYSLNKFIGTRNYTLTVFFDVSALTRGIYALSFGVFERYLIYDSEGNLLFHTGNSYSASHSDSIYDFLDLSEPSERISGLGGHYFVSQIENSGWIVAGYISHSNFNSAFIQQSISILLLFLLMSTFTITLTIPVIYRAMKPVKELSDVMGAVSYGDLSTRSAITTDDEIGKLSDIFNNMVESLQKNIDEKLAYETAEQRMKYNLLIAQFDSHFIYNTISSISALARKNRVDDIILLNTALTSLMQNYLRVKTHDVTDTIAQEIEMVQQYWIIANMRYDNHVNLVIDLPEELKNELIPKNLIQPLVENSLFHGLVNEDSGEMRGQINVSVIKNEDSIVIVVADNGKGIEPIKLAILNDSSLAENISKGKRGKHIGLHNIRQRLAYIYQQPDCMRIESTHLQGTTVTLVLPLF